jgi:predicted secreted protein
MKTLPLFALIFALLPGLVMAEHQIHFNVSSQTQVDNDLLVVTLMAQHQARTPDLVTEEINQAMQDALQQLSDDQRQYAQTGNYRIQPQYNKDGRIHHWQGQQQLILTLPKQGDIGTILTLLQDRLIYQSMHADLSHAQRQQAEQTLQQQALADYQAQAKRIAQSFNAQNWQLVETHIQTQSPNFRPQARMMMAADSAPSIEMGQQTLQIQVRGILKIE